jgi:hypothetical protein
MQATTRRGFWSSFWAGLAGLFAGSSSNAAAATKTDLSQIKTPAGTGLMGYANGSGVPVAVGSGLSLAGGVLSAPGTAAPPPVTAILTRDPSGNYPLPAGVRVRTKVYRNGSRQALGIDYTVVADVVTPVAAFPWEPDATVLVDGE